MNMKKVYVVTSGCYSDYGIEKIFSNRKEAEKYCALNNTNSRWGSSDLSEESMWDLSWEYEYRVEEYFIDDVEVLSTTDSLKTRYIYSIYREEESLDTYGTVYTDKNYIKIFPSSQERIEVAAILDGDWSIEKVKKIIRDEVACYKAGKNSLV